MKKTIYISILALAVVIASCGEKGSLSDKKKQLDKLKKEVASLEAEIEKLDTSAKADQKMKMVAVVDVAVSSFRHYIDIQGKVDADENVLVSPKMPGTVTSVSVKAGDMVKAGQVMATLDDKAARQGLEELKNRYELAKTVFERQKNLWDQKIGSEIAFLQAKNNKDALEKSMSTMLEQLDMYKVKSLINGVVDDVQIKVGQMGSPGMTTIRVVNNNVLKVKADVAETYASKIRTGNPVLISFPDIQRENMSSISYAGKVINPLTRTFNVESAITGDMNDFRPNMVAIMKIIDYENKSAIVIPINILQTDENGTFVFVLEGEKVVKKMVTTGLNYGGNIEIKSGLAAGEKLISVGYQDLNDGEKVKL
ncbi:MAG: efflux RND transporter periplasmic adaptor subunit [Bacteroidetes bacterium]|nr:efflux RND transporter periplasmic adaptor subunit [Bacteroidota bacterium]